MTIITMYQNKNYVCDLKMLYIFYIFSIFASHFSSTVAITFVF